MKNLKKISREQLKEAGISRQITCKPGYVYRCDAEGACIPEQNIWDCLCGCVPIHK